MESNLNYFEEFMNDEIMKRKKRSEDRF